MEKRTATFPLYILCTSDFLLLLCGYCVLCLIDWRTVVVSFAERSSYGNEFVCFEGNVCLVGGFYEFAVVSIYMIEITFIENVNNRFMW